MNQIDHDRLLREQEAASYLGISGWTIRRWRLSGRIPAIRLGHRTIRYRESDLKQFLLTNTSKAA